MDDKDKTQKEMAEYIVKWLYSHGLRYFSPTDMERMMFSDFGVVYIEFLHKMSQRSMYDILFNHEVAKKIFGEDDVCLDCGEVLISRMYDYASVQECSCNINPLTQPSWQYHLQQMVISDNPIKYVYDYLKSKEKDICTK